MPVIHCTAYTPGDPPGVRCTPGSMRCKGIITRRRSCLGPLPGKARRTGIHIKTIRYLRVVDSHGRKEDSGGSWTWSTGHLECLVSIYAWWILVDLDLYTALYARIHVAGSSWILMYARRILCSASHTLDSCVCVGGGGGGHFPSWMGVYSVNHSAICIIWAWAGVSSLLHY